MTEPAARASVTVHAPPDLVYAMVSDIERMPEWAVECERNSWLGADTAPRVGARFRGHNRKGGRRWSTTATVTAADPGSRFAFRVTSLGLPVSEWAYDIEPTPDGCRVTESTWYQVGFLLRRFLAPVVTGFPNRAVRTATNQRNIARTLEQLKAAAEARAASRPRP
jgi:uncharacterized protein YndB with AHSA1/START domain